MKSFFSSVVTAALCLCSFAFVSCNKNENKTPDPLTFSVTKAEVEVGKTVEVTVKNGTQPFTVKSSDEKIATVKVEKEKITVTGVAGGTATISVVDKNQRTGSFTVTVKAAQRSWSLTRPRLLSELRRKRLSQSSQVPLHTQ